MIKERICQRVNLEEMRDLKVTRRQESNSRGENAAVGTDLALCDEFPFRAAFSAHGIAQKAIPEARINNTLDGFLGGDFEHLDLLHSELLQTHENGAPVQSGIVGVIVAKPSPTTGVCVAVIANINVTITKAWTLTGITIDCPVLHFGLQRKSPRRDVVRILHREKKTLQTRVGLAAGPGIPFHRSEGAEDIPVRVQNHSQSVCVPVAAVLKDFRFETVRAAPPQKSKSLLFELREDLWESRNNHRIPPGWRR
jgi:hypothetical protein